MTNVKRLTTHQLVPTIFSTVLVAFAIAMVVLMLTVGMQTSEGTTFGLTATIPLFVGAALIFFNVDDVQNRSSALCMFIFVVSAAPMFYMGVVAAIAGGGAIR